MSVESSELSKPQLSKKCAYKKNNVDHDVPWSTVSNFVDYQPSTMLQPKDTGLPVIVDGKHLQTTESQIFCPMYWSLVPSWYKVIILFLLFNLSKNPLETTRVALNPMLFFTG